MNCRSREEKELAAKHCPQLFHECFYFKVSEKVTFDSKEIFAQNLGIKQKKEQKGAKQNLGCPQVLALIPPL